MNNKSHLPQIALHLIVVLVLPLALIWVCSKYLPSLGADKDMVDTVALFARISVLANVAVHPIPSQYNVVREPIEIFNFEMLPQETKKRFKRKQKNEDEDVYDEGEVISENTADDSAEKQSGQQKGIAQND